MYVFSSTHVVVIVMLIMRQIEGGWIIYANFITHSGEIMDYKMVTKLKGIIAH